MYLMRLWTPVSVEVILAAVGWKCLFWEEDMSEGRDGEYVWAVRRVCEVCSLEVMMLSVLILCVLDVNLVAVLAALVMCEARMDRLNVMVRVGRGDIYAMTCE